MSINEFLKWRIKSGMLKTIAGGGMRKFKAQTEDDKPHLQIKPPLSPVPLSFGSCSSKQRFNIPRLGIASAGLWTRWEGDNSAHQFAHLRVRPWRFTEFDAGPLRHHLKVIRNPGKSKICFWNPESWALESEIHPKRSIIPLTIGIWNFSSTEKESRFHYLESRIQVTAIGRLHDDVILPLRPESFRVLLSCANLGFCYRITKFKYERKTKGILVIVVKWRHHANGDLSHKIWALESNKLNDIG